MSRPKYIPSAYKEVGLTGQSVSSVNRQAHKKRIDGFAVSGVSRVPKMGHRFGVGFIQKGQHHNNTQDVCQNCGQAKFIIESTKCRGKAR